jgi:gluconokinase
MARAFVVMGVSGCGKSTLGRLIADRLQVRFLEGDDFHPPCNVAKMAAGIPLDDDDRWPWLDDVGAAIYANARACGVAVASCSALKRIYRDRLRAAAQGADPLRVPYRRSGSARATDG